MLTCAYASSRAQRYVRRVLRHEAFEDGDGSSVARRGLAARRRSGEGFQQMLVRDARLARVSRPRRVLHGERLEGRRRLLRHGHRFLSARAPHRRGEIAPGAGEPGLHEPTRWVLGEQSGVHRKRPARPRLRRLPLARDDLHLRQLQLGSREGLPVVPRRERRRGECAAQGESPRQALAGAARVAEVRLEHATLNAGHALVGRRKLALQSRVSVLDVRELFGVLQRALHDQLARRRRAGQVADRVVELEQERVRELPHVVEVPLRGRALGPRDFRLIERRGQRRAEREGADHRGRRTGLVASDELARPIRERVLTRRNRAALEIALQVLGEGADRLVASLGLLAERLEHDVVEIPGDARTLRLLVADGAGDRLGGGAIRRAVGAAAGQQVIEARHPGNRCPSPS